tara:strand:+ start:128 stop:868 length:741 start_codon:yes stop_codon:yes gene_type:complete
MNLLNNKTAIITGSSRGIGKEIACLLYENGANVILLSRNTENLKTAFNSFKVKKNQFIKYYSLDISNNNDVQDTFKKIINEHKNIDILVNNAGITADNLLLKMKDSDWNDVINTNLNGCYYCCKAVIKTMLKQKNGNIINISSVIGQTGNKGQANYAASKSGIYGLTKSLAKELGSRGIRVNAVNPGYIKTNMTDNLENNAEYLNNIPLKRYGNVKDVANLVCFLASENSSYITGQTINVDGGLLM